MTRPSATLANVNVFAGDIAALSHFYKDLFGFAEILSRRTEIYRVLVAGEIELGFNSYAAYDLLELADRRASTVRPTTVYCTFDLSQEASLEEVVSRAVALGAKVVKQIYRTHYNSEQAVLEDPEMNIFRVNQKPSVLPGAHGSLLPVASPP
jgi:uncharacterized glyoxalase superfamily protein PhnB